MAGATVITVIGPGIGQGLFPLVIGLLSAFVVYGRWWLVRSPRSDDMRFMINRNADKNTEAGVLPSQDVLAG